MANGYTMKEAFIPQQSKLTFYAKLVLDLILVPEYSTVMLLI